MAGTEWKDLFRLIFLTTFLGSIDSCYVQRAPQFPISYVDRSIDLSVGNDELYLPSGKCDDTTMRDRDLSLILPKTCPPRTLYSGFIVSNRVSCLSLSDCLIEGVSRGSFDRLENLIYLDLSKNRIQLCDLLSFGGHPSLKTLILDENILTNDRGTTIDRADFFPSLEHLYLRKNSLSQLRLSIRRNFPILTHLYLTDNLLSSESITDLTDLPISLTHLYLERNRIDRVDSRLIRDLRSIFLDGNAIRSIGRSRNCWYYCVNLRGATKLRYLSLSRNEITSIDHDGFADAWNLRSLNLAENRLETIAIGTFDRLCELVDLSLSNNRLTNVPDLRQTRRLTSLRIDNNLIGMIRSNDLRDLHRLKWLSLRNNRLREIENGAFWDLRSLEELDLSNNLLDRLSFSWINNQTPLRVLDLRGNRFTSYDYLYLRDITSLTNLYIQNNPFTSYDRSDRVAIGRNTSVHVNHDEIVVCYICETSNPRITHFHDSAI